MRTRKYEERQNSDRSGDEYGSPRSNNSPRQPLRSLSDARNLVKDQSNYRQDAMDKN